MEATDNSNDDAQPILGISGFLTTLCSQSEKNNTTYNIIYDMLPPIALCSSRKLQKRIFHIKLTLNDYRLVCTK